MVTLLRLKRKGRLTWTYCTVKSNKASEHWCNPAKPEVFFLITQQCFASYDNLLLKFLQIQEQTTRFNRSLSIDALTVTSQFLIRLTGLLIKKDYHKSRLQ